MSVSGGFTSSHSTPKSSRNPYSVRAMLVFGLSQNIWKNNAGVSYVRIWKPRFHKSRNQKIYVGRVYKNLWSFEKFSFKSHLLAFGIMSTSISYSFLEVPLVSVCVSFQVSFEHMCWLLCVSWTLSSTVGEHLRCKFVKRPNCGFGCIRGTLSLKKSKKSWLFKITTFALIKNSFIESEGHHSARTKNLHTKNDQIEQESLARRRRRHILKKYQYMQ